MKAMLMREEIVDRLVRTIEAQLHVLYMLNVEEDQEAIEELEEALKVLRG